MANDDLCSTISVTSKFLPTILFHDFSFLCSTFVSHPLYSSFLVLFSPYLFKLISFISPLFFTTSLLVVVSIVATGYTPSKVGFIQTVVEELRLKMSRVHEDDDVREFEEFEEFEIYKIVFRDPPVLAVGDVDYEGVDEQESVMEVAELEEERRLERLFEELDRFEDYTTGIDATEKETRPIAEGFAGELEKLAPVVVPICSEDEKTLDNFLSVKLSQCRPHLATIGDSTTPIEENVKEKETRTINKRFTGELQKLAPPVAVPICGEGEKTLDNCFSVKVSQCRPDSSTIGDLTTPIEKNVKENETRAIDDGVAGELQKLAPVAVAISGEDKKTLENLFSVKLSSCGVDSATIGDSTTPIEKNENKNETKSQIKRAVEELQKISEPAKVSSKKTDANSFSAKSNPTRSHVLGVIQKFETVAISSITVSGEEQKSVQNSFSMKSNSWRSDSSTSFGSYGSMRKEKEWKRTLACKLFEERHNSGGEEGMDSLWEAYEEDNSSRRSKHRKETEAITKHKKKTEFKYFDDGEADQQQEQDDDEDDEFMSNGQLCCLKALKLSTGKMNLGMGKPNLVKITKVLKGFGWLHHVGSSKQGKKN